jgi:uncharacterized protein DUF1707
VEVRVGDRDRELAAGALRRHFVQGRLSPDELAERVDLTLRARSDGDLAAAMDGLPPVWRDVPATIHAATWRVRRGVHRARFFFSLLRVWFRLNLALVVAAGIALVVGAPAVTTVGAVVAACALTTLAFWHVWRRGL